MITGNYTTRLEKTIEVIARGETHLRQVPDIPAEITDAHLTETQSATLALRDVANSLYYLAWNGSDGQYDNGTMWDDEGPLTRQVHHMTTAALHLMSGLVARLSNLVAELPVDRGQKTKQQESLDAVLTTHLTDVMEIGVRLTQSVTTLKMFDTYGREEDVRAHGIAP